MSWIIFSSTEFRLGAGAGALYLLECRFCEEVPVSLSLLLEIVGDVPNFVVWQPDTHLVQH